MQSLSVSVSVCLPVSVSLSLPVIAKFLKRAACAVFFQAPCKDHLAAAALVRHNRSFEADVLGSFPNANGPYHYSAICLEKKKYICNPFQHGFTLLQQLEQLYLEG